MTGMICTGFALGFAYLTCEPVGQQALDQASYCAVSEPVRPRRKDTPHTIRAANREFAKWKALCAR